MQLKPDSNSHHSYEHRKLLSHDTNPTFRLLFMKYSFNLKKYSYRANSFITHYLNTFSLVFFTFCVSLFNTPQQHVAKGEGHVSAVLTVTGKPLPVLHALPLQRTANLEPLPKHFPPCNLPKECRHPGPLGRLPRSRQLPCYHGYNTRFLREAISPQTPATGAGS